MNLMSIISKAAPLIGGLLAGGPVGVGLAAMKMIASEFGVEPEEDKIAAAIKADPSAMVKLRKLELDNKTELLKLTLGAASAEQAQVNKTMRAEANSDNSYVRNWRPTIGYVLAFQFALIGLSVFIVVIGALFTDDPLKAKALFDGLSALMSSMIIIIGAEASVVGVNIVQRSKDKAVSNGHAPGAGFLTGIFSKGS